MVSDLDQRRLEQAVCEVAAAQARLEIVQELIKVKRRNRVLELQQTHLATNIGECENCGGRVLAVS